MKIIGLTGGISSGKSTVSTIIKGGGFPLVDCDLISRELYEDKDFADGIISIFGTAVVSNGKLDKRKLSVLVFTDADKLKTLSKYIHPRIFKKVQDEINSYAVAGAEYVFVDAPILFESGLDKAIHFDEIIAVSISRENQVKRLKIRNPEKSDKEINGIISTQFSDKKRKSKATIVIDNNGTKDELINTVLDILENIQLRGYIGV